MVNRFVVCLLLASFASILCPAASRAENASVPSGTTVHCRLAQTLTTGLTRLGEPFTANVSEPVIIGSREAIPAGAKIEGRVAWMERPGRIKGVGEMRLLPEKITFSDGRSYPLGALLISANGAEGARVTSEEGTIRGPSSRMSTAKEVGGLAAGGGVFGLIVHHPVLGIAVGGAAGFLDRVRKRGQDLALPQGTQLDYQLTRALEISR